MKLLSELKWLLSCKPVALSMWIDVEEGTFESKSMKAFYVPYLNSLLSYSRREYVSKFIAPTCNKWKSQKHGPISVTIEEFDRTKQAFRVSCLFWNKDDAMLWKLAN